MSTTFNVGDFVLIRKPDDSMKKKLGKIVSLSQNDNQKTFKYTPYLFPEQTPEGRQLHNSINEVYKTEDEEEDLISNINDQWKVIPLNEYLSNKYSKNTSNIYFYRQTYNKKSHSYLPDLDPSCYCNKLFNPDMEYMQCSKCKEFFHKSCYITSKKQKCFNELCSNIIQNQMTTLQYNHMKSYANDILGKKRERTNDTMQRNQSDEKYRNLRIENRNYLIGLIENIENKKSLLINANEVEKTRQNARDQIMFVLLYGIEELKQSPNEHWNKYNGKNKPINKVNIQDSTKMFKHCESLSRDIEYALSEANRFSLSAYKKKLLTLITNLNDERNYELRENILFIDVSPKKLVSMNSEELAPPSVKKKRVEQQNKYFKEQVYVDVDSRVILKTHKGDAIISIDPKDKVNEGFISYQILENRNDQKQKEEDYSSEGSDEENDKNLQQKKIKNKEEIKKIQDQYKNLPVEKIKFLIDLELYSKENLTEKINKRISKNLCKESRDEMNLMRKESLKISSL